MAVGTRPPLRRPRAATRRRGRAATALAAAAAALLAAAASGQERAPHASRDDDPFGLTAPRTDEERRALAASLGLARAERELATLYLRRRPERARALGWPGFAGSPGEYDGGPGSPWVVGLRHASNALLAHPAHHFAPERRATRDWLRGWVDAEITLAARARTTLDPAWYVEGLIEALRAHVDEGPGEPAPRARRLQGVLARIPDVLESALAALETSRAGWNEHAAELAFDLVLFLQDERVVGAAADAPASLADEVAVARRAAAKAARAYADHLVARRGTGDGWRMNGEAWHATVRATSGTALTLDELEATLLRHVATLRRSVESAVSEAHVEDALDLARLAREVRVACVVANHVAVAAELLPAPLPVPEVRAREAILRAGPLVTESVAASGALALDVHVPAAYWSAGERATRRARLDAGGRVAIGVRYGPAGEAALRARSSWAEPRSAAAIPNRCAVEGFGLYATDWMLRVDVAGNPLQAPRIARALRRERLIEAARLLAALRLHGRGAPAHEVALELALLTDMDAAMAQREVLRATRDPLRGIGYLGYVELRALEEAFAERMDAQRALARAYGSALAHPCARVPDLLRLGVIDRE